MSRTRPEAGGAARIPAASAREVFLAFLLLGLTSFGGPVAHLGYFRAEFVERRRWLDDHDYSDLVALCHFLPGPTSSQVGFTLGLSRAGWPGALAAWLGFTLPSALLLIAFGYGIAGNAALAASGAVHGLKLAAVAIVAQAILGMGRTLCPDAPRQAIALAAALLTLLLPSAFAQLLVIALAALAGRLWLVPSPRAGAGAVAGTIPVRVAAGALALFVILLVALPAWAAGSDSALAAQVHAFYRAGALVFGGGHVVLPLLHASLVPPGFVDDASFLAGYGAAQAVPGPLFSFAAYLGTVAGGPLPGWANAVVMLVAVFAPGFLLVLGALPFRDVMRTRAGVQSAIAGVNAGVVGILLSALYDPVWTSAVHSRADFAIALASFAMLAAGRLPPLAVVAFAALAGWLAG